MKRQLWLLGLVGLVGIGVAALWGFVFAPTRVAVGAPEVQATPSAPPPACVTHTVGMTLTVSNRTPQVGEMLAVTITLANEGCGMIGLPQYRLYVTQPAYVLAPESPAPVSHTLGLNPGETDAVTFTLHTLGPGMANLHAFVSFEVHLSYTGPTYWGTATALPLTITVPATATEIVVLQQAAYALGCFPPIMQHDATYTFGCAPAAGHSFDAQIQTFTDEDSARTAFEGGQGTLLLTPFRCYPAYAWVYEQETPPQWQGWHRWLAERWVITTHSIDDSGLQVSPAPLEVSEAIYHAAARNHLFLPCERLYLPLVCRANL